MHHLKIVDVNKFELIQFLPIQLVTDQQEYSLSIRLVKSVYDNFLPEHGRGLLRA